MDTRIIETDCAIPATAETTTCWKCRIVELRIAKMLTINTELFCCYLQCDWGAQGSFGKGVGNFGCLVRIEFASLLNPW